MPPRLVDCLWRKFACVAVVCYGWRYQCWRPPRALPRLSDAACVKPSSGWASALSRPGPGKPAGSGESATRHAIPPFRRQTLGVADEQQPDTAGTQTQAVQPRSSGSVARRRGSPRDARQSRRCHTRRLLGPVVASRTPSPCPAKCRTCDRPRRSLRPWWTSTSRRAGRGIRRPRSAPRGVAAGCLAPSRASGKKARTSLRRIPGRVESSGVRRPRSSAADRATLTTTASPASLRRTPAATFPTSSRWSRKACPADAETWRGL